MIVSTPIADSSAASEASSTVHTWKLSPAFLTSRTYSALSATEAFASMPEALQAFAAATANAITALFIPCLFIIVS